MYAIDQANGALNAGLDVDVGESTVNGLAVASIDTEELNQLMEGFTALDGTGVALDVSTVNFFGPDGELFSYAEAIYHVVKLMSVLVHEIAHTVWIKHFLEYCNSVPPAACAAIWASYNCHVAAAEALNYDQLPCTEAYAYETESEKMCAIGCAMPPGLGRETAKDAADIANERCDEEAAKCAQMSSPPPNGCGPLPQPADQGGCRGPCTCDD